ncbi:MAG: hypothetical protein ABSG97_05075 [Sedimentisphaerales bacterium]|jgi:hypothetical protein
MMELNLFGWVVVASCAVMVGISKTGLPGMGILFVPLMAMVMPARQSTGAVLGIVALKKMPQKVFEITIQVLALAAGIKLLVPANWFAKLWF